LLFGRVRDDRFDYQSINRIRGEDMSQELELTGSNFEQEVLKSAQPVLVDFWAEWCGPCRMMNPIIAEIASAYAGKVKVGKVNVDQNAELSSQYGIQGIPALLIFKNGEVAKQIVGAQPADKLKSALDSVI
jgi:thioredoxin 1